jgi:hypothetical protein
LPKQFQSAIFAQTFRCRDAQLSSSLQTITSILDTPRNAALDCVEIMEENQSLKLVFTHENFATEELLKDHQEGWEGALSKLSTFITKGGIGHGK